MRYKIMQILLIIILASSLVAASTTYTWNLESQFVSGSFPAPAQINLDNTGVCDAIRFIYLGYDYPGLNVKAPGTCDLCAGTGTLGMGFTSYMPSGQDIFSECNGVDCAGYYVQTGTQDQLTIEDCYDKTDEPAATHYCDGGGSCQTAAQVCPDNSADTLKYSCGICKYISSSNCVGTTLGSCSNYAAGTDTGICRECDGSGGERAPSDDSACGTIDCDGKNIYFTSGGASATGTNYCKYRNYADITSNRCEGLGNCKDANTADCTSYVDSTAATCGTCKYASGACSSCTNYGSGTSCGTGMECDGAGNCAIEYLVYGIHSSNQCTSLGGTIVSDGADKFCRFNQGSCPGGWAQFKSWSTTFSTFCACDGCDDGSTNGVASGSHSFSDNSAIETSFYYCCNPQNYAQWPCMGTCDTRTCYATRTEIGCY